MIVIELVVVCVCVCVYISLLLPYLSAVPLGLTTQAG